MSKSCDFCEKKTDILIGLLCEKCHSSKGIQLMYSRLSDPETEARLKKYAERAKKELPLFE